jgi:hypothetical protein
MGFISKGNFFMTYSDSNKGNPYKVSMNFFFKLKGSGKLRMNFFIFMNCDLENCQSAGDFITLSRTQANTTQLKELARFDLKVKDIRNRWKEVSLIEEISDQTEQVINVLTYFEYFKLESRLVLKNILYV